MLELRVRRKRRQAGDTIIEVLIAIAIVGTVLLGVYITTVKNSQTTQDSQERSQALQLAQAQIEYLRAAGSLPSGKDCFSASGAQAATNLPGNDPCVITAGGMQAANGVQPAYVIRISGGNPYVLSVTWVAATGNGNANVTLYYRTGL